MALLETLTTLANTLHVERVDSPAPVSGDPVRVRLAPTTSGLSVTDLAAAPVDLTFISKGVQFVSAQPEPDVLQAAIEGGTPRDRRDDATTTMTGTWACPDLMDA